MGDIAGTNLSSSNPRLKFLIFVFGSVVVFGVLLYWREHYVESQEYVQFDIPKHMKKASISSSANRMLETQKELMQ